MVFNRVSKVIHLLVYPTPLSQPIRSEIKTNLGSLTNVFLCVAPATCICFRFWLVHWIVCVLCDWSYETQLKTPISWHRNRRLAYKEVICFSFLFFFEVPYTDISSNAKSNLWPVIKRWRQKTDAFELVNSYGLFRRWFVWWQKIFFSTGCVDVGER